MKNTLNTISASRPVASIFDTPAEILPETPKVYLNYNFDPLALVCHMLNLGKHSSDIVSTLCATEFRPEQKLHAQDQKSVPVITEKAKAEADAIYNHFANKLTVRRIKYGQISSWATEVEKLCENRRTITGDSMGVLVTLPKFYKENLEIEQLIKQYQSVNTGQYTSMPSFDQTVTFVKCIQRRTSRASHNDYYWKTSDNNLVRVRVKTSDMGIPAWNFFADQQQIKISSGFIVAEQIRGYDFTVLSTHPDIKVSLI